MAAPTITDSVIVMGTGAGPITTGNLTIASGDVVYVGVLLSDGSPGTVSSVTSSGGGGAFSSIGDSGVVESFLRCHIWRSTSPTAGTVTISMTPGASTSEIGVIAVSVAGVNSGTPNGTAAFANGNGIGADATSASISSDTNAIVLDFLGRFQTPPPNAIVSGGQTELEQGVQAATLTAASSWEAGATTVVTSWDDNGASTVSNWQWVLGALSINGATGGGGAALEESSWDSTQNPPTDNVFVSLWRKMLGRAQPAMA